MRHPRKVAWLIHQYRAAYDLCGTIYSDFEHVELDVGLRQTLMDLDRRMLGECERRFANARNTATRLARFNGLTAEPLYHPPRLAAAAAARALRGLRAVGGPDRIGQAGRPPRSARWRSSDRPVRLGWSAATARSARTPSGSRSSLGLADRVSFLGAVDDDSTGRALRRRPRRAYAPFDEDFGYVTLEAFLARKPVVTALDSGGPLEFVEDGVNGYVRPPTPDAFADAIDAPRRRSPPGRVAGRGGIR